MGQVPTLKMEITSFILSLPCRGKSAVSSEVVLSTSSSRSWEGKTLHKRNMNQRRGSLRLGIKFRSETLE